jgi:hypothetical protein
VMDFERVLCLCMWCLRQGRCLHRPIVI